MSCLTSFIFNNYPVTVLFDVNDIPWFKGKDVAKILGYANDKKALLVHVSERFKSTKPEVSGTQFGSDLTFNESKVVYISEPGLYELIFSSRLPAAKEFKYWVFEEVLPAIRKRGEFKLKYENQHLLESLNKSLENTRHLESRKAQIEASKADIETKNKVLNQTITQQVPKVAVFPNNNDLKHVFCILIKEDMLEKYGVCEYKCIRTEKRNFNRALKKAKEKGFEMCFYRENIPNGVNIFNRAKEIMKSNCMHYESAFNNVVTSQNLINIIEDVIDHGTTI